MTGQDWLRTILPRWSPAAVAGLSAAAAMTFVGREWAAQVGLLVYFPVLFLLDDGLDLFNRDLFDRKRLARFFVAWRSQRASG